MAANKLGGQVITWGITIVVARLLSPEDYGLIALSGIFTLFAMSISEMGIGAAVIQRDSISEDEIRSLYSVAILVGLGMTAMGYFAAIPMALIYDEPRLIPLVRAQSIVFSFAALSGMQRNILVRNTCFSVVARIELCANVMTSLCALTLAWNGFGVWALVAQGLLTKLFEFVGFSYYSRIVPKLRVDFSAIYDVMRYGVVIMLNGLGNTLFMLSDTMILGKFASPLFLGGYSFGRNLTRLPFEKVLSIVNQVLFPFLSKEKNNPQQLRAWFGKLMKFELFLFLPFYVFLFFCAEEIVYIVLGPKWEIVILPLRVFCVASFFRLIDSFGSTLLIALGNVRIPFYINIVKVAVVSLPILAVCYWIGYVESLYVWIITPPLISIGYLFFIKRSIQLQMVSFFMELLPLLIANLALVTMSLIIGMDPVAAPMTSLLVKFSLGGTVFFVALLIFGRHIMFEFYSEFTRFLRIRGAEK